MRGSLYRAALVALALGGAAAPLSAQPTGLSLTVGETRSDPGGAFVNVSVANATGITIDEIVVSCTFSDNGRSVGSSSTTLFATVNGMTAQDQVRLLGATATNAQCKISSVK